jgi:hypothetical protein
VRKCKRAVVSSILGITGQNLTNAPESRAGVPTSEALYKISEARRDLACFRRWLRREKPDSILTLYNVVAHWLKALRLNVPGDILGGNIRYLEANPAVEETGEARAAERGLVQRLKCLLLRYRLIIKLVIKQNIANTQRLRQWPVKTRRQNELKLKFWCLLIVILP